MSTDQDLVDRLDEVWTSIDELGAELSDADWELPTECPGWSVQDQLAHLAHIEGRLLGRPRPGPRAPRRSAAREELVRHDQRGVRRLPPPRTAREVLAEFHEYTRVAASRALADRGDFDADSWTPMGPGTVRDLLPFRIFDAWVHEQDMRRAVGRPGDLDTPVAELAWE